MNGKLPLPSSFKPACASALPTSTQCKVRPFTKADLVERPVVPLSFVLRGALDEAACEQQKGDKTLSSYLFVLIPCVFGFAFDRRTLNT